ncbi:MAG: hypothetical protein K2K45_03615 [Muribaculaceae bacterium]|nr:hypothetical protein [Muribaculaceae bacterium]
MTKKVTSFSLPDYEADVFTYALFFLSESYHTSLRIFIISGRCTANKIYGITYSGIDQCLREMNYDKAVEWLSKVSKDYQNRTNIAKDGYFKLDPFKYQSDKKNYISDSDDYKLRFAQEMLSLERMINSDTEPNRKANAKIRYAIGLRNSFGKCWYLTQYGYNLDNEYAPGHWDWFSSNERKGFKKNAFAQIAYKKVDALTSQALSEFTDKEQAAQAHLEMMNYNTLMKQYPATKAALKIRGRCDNYYDYALQKR